MKGVISLLLRIHIRLTNRDVEDNEDSIRFLRTVHGATAAGDPRPPQWLVEKPLGDTDRRLRYEPL